MCFPHHSFISRHEFEIGALTAEGIQLLPFPHNQTHAPTEMRIHSLHEYHLHENSYYRPGINN